MGNRLYSLLEKFSKNGLSQKERQLIIESDNKECPQSTDVPITFKLIAYNILSGHFLVSNKIKVFPTCVEIYYHEEAADGIKDYIVYHRNTPKDPDKPIFGLGILHNHVSGIDITFEHMVNGQAVRASALIREFRAEGIEKDKDNYKDGEDRSTYLYDALFSQFNIFEGFSIKWCDGPEENSPYADIDNKVTVGVRKNVAKYEINKETNKEAKMGPSQDRTLNTEDNKHFQCQRRWQFKLK